MTEYLALKQALGRQFDCERRVLEHLDQFLAQEQWRDLDASAFTAWCKTGAHLASGDRACASCEISVYTDAGRNQPVSCPISNSFRPNINAFNRIFSREKRLRGSCMLPAGFNQRGPPRCGRTRFVSQ
jgi:hypothetical protein